MTRGHGPDSQATCAGPALDPPPPALPTAFPDSGSTGCWASLVFLGSPHRLFLHPSTLWRVCSAHSPPRPTHCPPCQDSTCIDMPLATKLWTSLEGPAHVPTLVVVTLPQTPPHPCPWDCPRPSCLLRETAQAPRCPPSTGTASSPVHTTLCPGGQGARAFSPRPSPPCVEDGHLEPHRAWRRASRHLLMVPTQALFSA